MNAILKEVIEARNGHYTHAVEVSTAYELECIAEAITQEHQEEHSEGTIIDFLQSLTVYYLPEENEQENEEEEQRVHNFSFTDYVKETI